MWSRDSYCPSPKSTLTPDEARAGSPWNSLPARARPAASPVPPPWPGSAQRLRRPLASPRNHHPESIEFTPDNRDLSWLELHLE